MPSTHPLGTVCVGSLHSYFMPPRLYRYVGPEDIKQRSRRGDHCVKVVNAGDVLRWTDAFLRKGSTRGIIPATFIIDVNEALWIADRHSEHVACADGRDVLAAGEMFFERAGKSIQVVEVTNQSTGYCPEPDFWEIVAQALDQANLRRPPAFTDALTFRRCDQCMTTNIVKVEVFECTVCQSPLSHQWNFSAAERDEVE